MTLPTSAAERKAIPLATGFLDYFPKASAAVAELSRIGNEQHNPGKPLHWDRSKSTDEADCLMRHFMERGTIDTDGVRHSTKVAWRAMALLEKEIEATRVEIDPESLRVAAAKRAAHNADPTTRHGIALETKFGFTVGETVNAVRCDVGHNPGIVRGFIDGRIGVDFSGNDEGVECCGRWDPLELRHGA